MIQTYPFLKEEMEKHYKDSRLKKDQNSLRQIPNLATTAQPILGAHDNVLWAPTGLDSPVPPALQPVAYVCSLLTWLFSVPAEVQIRGISNILESLLKLGLQLYAHPTPCRECNIAAYYLASATLWNLIGP